MLQSRTLDVFNIQAIFHYYQPNTAARELETGHVGTGIISPNSISLAPFSDQIDRSLRALRDLWKSNVVEKPLPGAMPLAPLIDAASLPIPPEYTVKLPLAERFKRDSTYAVAYIEQPNDASFQDVIEALMPFKRLRETVRNIQDQLIVPLHSVQIGVTNTGLKMAPVPVRLH